MSYLIKYAVVCVLSVLALYVVIRTYTVHTAPVVLTGSTPIIKDLPTEKKVLPVVIVKKTAVEQRLRVVIPEGNSVTATASLKPSETGYGVLSVINESTGVTEIQQYEKPRDALGFPMTGRVSVGIGTGSTGDTLKLAAEITPLRIGSVYISGEIEARIGTLRTAEWYSGVKAELRF